RDQCPTPSARGAVGGRPQSNRSNLTARRAPSTFIEAVGRFDEGGTPLAHGRIPLRQGLVYTASSPRLLIEFRIVTAEWRSRSSSSALSARCSTRSTPERPITEGTLRQTSRISYAPVIRLETVRTVFWSRSIASTIRT